MLALWKHSVNLPLNESFPPLELDRVERATDAVGSANPGWSLGQGLAVVTMSGEGGRDFFAVSLHGLHRETYKLTI